MPRGNVLVLSSISPPSSGSNPAHHKSDESPFAMCALRERARPGAPVKTQGREAFKLLEMVQCAGGPRWRSGSCR